MYNVTLWHVRVTTVASYKMFHTAVSNKRFSVAHVKWPIFLPDFNRNLDLRHRFPWSPQYQISRWSFQWESLWCM